MLANFTFRENMGQRKYFEILEPVHVEILQFRSESYKCLTNKIYRIHHDFSFGQGAHSLSQTVLIK